MILITAVFLLSLVAIAFPLIAILALIEELKFTLKSKEFKGRVVDFEKVRGVTGVLTYAPVVDWIGPDGKSRRVRCGDFFSSPRYATGQSVVVLCGPYKKDLRVRVKSFREQFLDPICILLFSLVALGVYIFVLIKHALP